MLIRSTWLITVPKKVTLPRTYALELGNRLHRRLGIDLSASNVCTTFVGLVGPCSRVGEFVVFQPDEFYKLMLTGYAESGSKAIAQLDLGDRLEFLGTEFRVGDRQDHTTTYEELYTLRVANEPEPNHCFPLRFETPTAFAQGGLQLPLPVPTMMFRSWLNRWNSFSPIYLGGEELLGHLNEVVALNRHRIQTATFQLKKGWITGFVGDAQLQVLRRADPLVAQVAELLVEYGQFAGTGMKTRLGMGQITIKQPEP